MLRRVALVLAILLAALLAGVPAWIALHRDDLPAVDDADLEARAFEGTPDGDGWVALQEAADAVVWPEEPGADDRVVAMLRGEAWEPAWLEARLQQNAAAFAALERGLAAPALRIPAFRIEDDEFGDVLLGVQTLVKLAALRGRLSLANGDAQGAFESALLGMRVGRKVSEARGVNLLSMMMATAFQGIALSAVESLLRDQRLPGAHAGELVARLEARRWEPEAWERVWASEYRSVRAMIREAAQAYRDDPVVEGAAHGPAPWLLRWIPADYVFQPNRTLGLLSDHHRELGRGGALDCRDVYGEAVPGSGSGDAWSPPSFWQMLVILASPNAAGRLVVEVGTPNLQRFDAKRCHLETKISLVQALAALTAYRHDHGALPGRLDALVPDYLPAVPEDRFAGEPLRWSRERGVVWSVGEDLVDDGPPAEPSQGDASAPAVRVAPAQPRSAVLPISSRARS